MIVNKENVLSITNNTEGLYADDLYSATLSFIITITSILASSFDRSAIENSEMNKILNNISTIPQLELINKLKKT